MEGFDGPDGEVGVVFVQLGGCESEEGGGGVGGWEVAEVHGEIVGDMLVVVVCECVFVDEVVGLSEGETEHVYVHEWLLVSCLTNFLLRQLQTMSQRPIAVYQVGL